MCRSCKFRSLAIFEREHFDSSIERACHELCSESAPRATCYIVSMSRVSADLNKNYSKNQSQIIFNLIPFFDFENSNAVASDGQISSRLVEGDVADFERVGKRDRFEKLELSQVPDSHFVVARRGCKMITIFGEAHGFYWTRMSLER